MKCFNHPKEDAVATCLDCGKGMCQECAAKFETPICKSCNAKRLRGDKKLIYRNIILMLVCYIAGFFIAWKGMNASIIISIATAYIFAGIPWGWSFLSRLTPGIFLFLPVVGWVIYFCLKLTLAYLIGFVVLTVKIIQLVIAGVRANKLSKDIQSA